MASPHPKLDQIRALREPQMLRRFSRVPPPKATDDFYTAPGPVKLEDKGISKLQASEPLEPAVIGEQDVAKKKSKITPKKAGKSKANRAKKVVAKSNKRKVSNAPASGGFDKTAYQREYMRQVRAKARAEAVAKAKPNGAKKGKRKE
jgi:hypothetical protein